MDYFGLVTVCVCVRFLRVKLCIAD